MRLALRVRKASPARPEFPAKKASVERRASRGRRAKRAIQAKEASEVHLALLLRGLRRKATFRWEHSRPALGSEGGAGSHETRFVAARVSGLVTFLRRWGIDRRAAAPSLCCRAWLVAGTRSDSARGAPNDYAVVNHGQLKHVATQASAEFEEYLPGGAGVEINTLVGGWLPPHGLTDDFATVNLGQLKAVAKPFYDRLASAGYRGHRWRLENAIHGAP